MISREPRCSYERNYLISVICQLRFPVIPEIGSTYPKAFGEAVADLFSEYSIQQEPAIPPIVRTPTVNHQFSSRDGQWRLNLTDRFLSVSTREYRGWETLARYLDKPLVALLSIYHPLCFERVGLRYINAFEKSLRGEPCAYRDLISPCYLGALGQEDVEETAVLRSSVDTELTLGGGCRVKIHAGPGMIKTVPDSRQIRFIFDQDLYLSGKIPAAYCAGALEDVHSQAYGIFRGAITEQLHDSMGPISI